MIYLTERILCGGFFLFLFVFVFCIKRVKDEFLRFFKDFLPIKKSQEIKQEKEDARQLKEHWGEIASAKELQLTDEDIQTLKDFMKDL